LAQLIEQAVQVLLVDEVANRMEDALITAIFRPHGMSEDEINRHIGTLLHRRDSNAVRAAAAGVADPRFQSLVSSLAFMCPRKRCWLTTLPL